MRGESDHVTDGIGDMPTCLVGVVSLTLLSLTNAGLSLGQIVMDELESGCSRWIGGFREEGGRDEWMMAGGEVERGESRGGGDGVVVGELQQGKDIFPCFLAGLHEGS